MASFLFGPYRIAIDDETLAYEVNPAGTEEDELLDVLFFSEKEAVAEYEIQVAIAAEQAKADGQDPVEIGHDAEGYAIRPVLVPGGERAWRIVDRERMGTDIAQMVFTRNRREEMRGLLLLNQTRRLRSQSVLLERMTREPLLG